MPNITELAHQLVRTALETTPEGVLKLAVDATVGNGYDTLWLATHVGPDGFIAGCDIQESAVEIARRRLEQSGIRTGVELSVMNHARLAQTLPATWRESVSAIMANFGYLPGGDKSVISQRDTSLTMVSSLLPFLRTGGVMTLALYSGHPGGRVESEAILDYAGNLNPKAWKVLHCSFPNQTNSPPELVCIEKTS